MKPQESITEIIEKVLAGELEHYREIVRAYEADVLRVAAPALGSRTAAEDLTQEVFITAYNRLDSFDRTQSFRAWILGIAANHVRNEIRRKSREKSRLVLYSRYLDAVTAKQGADDSLVNTSQALAECREKLQPAASAAIRGRYDEGLSLDAVAENLQRSVTATTQLIYRARLALRDCIEARLASEGGKA